MLSVRPPALTPVRSHVYVSERRGRFRGAWAVMHQQQTYLHQQREPRIIHAVCFHISYDGEDIRMQFSAAALPYSADWRCQARLSSVQKCPVPAGRCQDGRITVVCKQPTATAHEALAASCVQAGGLLSSICLRMHVQGDSGLAGLRESAIRPSCPCCEVQPYPVVWD